LTQGFWTADDFNVFSIEGLEHRMNALQTKIQPKFQVIGEHISTYLSSRGTGEFFPHVAKHARRTVNPPNDSWVAFAAAKRGYKALPISKSVYGERICSSFWPSFTRIRTRRELLKGLVKTLMS